MRGGTNVELKAGIILKDGSIKKCANGLGIHPNRLSKIIQGYLKPKPDEMRRLAWRLQKPIHVLFPPEDGVGV